MSKQIAVVIDVTKRVVIGASKDEYGFKVVHIPEGHSVVVTCEGSFAWNCVPTDAVEEADDSSASPTSEKP